MTKWTVQHVEAMFEEAAATLRRLPSERPQGFKSAMPTPVRNIHEAYGYNEVRVRLPPPSAAAIDRLDMVLGWSGWLSEDQAKVVWARACRVPWRPICVRLGCGRTKAWQVWVTALVLVKAKLNEAAVPLPKTAA
jgi:hypothetical protein